MKSKNCAQCGCINWATASQCIRCKSDLLETQSGIKTQSINQSSIESQPQNDYDSGFNIVSLFKILIIVGVLITVGFIYSNYFSLDKMTMVSSFNQYYYGIVPPSETELKYAIVKINTRPVKKKVEERRPQTFTQCPGNVPFVPGSSSGFNCVPVNELVDTQSERVVEGFPNLISFEIKSSNLAKDGQGKLVYRGEYNAVSKGVNYNDPYVVEEPVKTGTVEQSTLLNGVIILYWNETEKKWSSPALKLK